MVEEVSKILINLQNPDEAIRAQAEAAVNSLKEQNIVGFIQVLNQIISTPNSPPQLLAMSIILTWQLFPEEISDLDIDAPHPFDVYSQPLVENILNVSHNLMISGDLSIRHLAATLFGRVASLQVHRNLDSKIFLKLSEELASTQDINIIRSISIALVKICTECEPEDNELSALLTAIFKHLTNPTSPEVTNEVSKILSSIINSMAQILEDEKVCNTIVSVLISLLQTPGCQCSALTSWIELYKIVPELLVMLSQQLVPLVLLILSDPQQEEATLLNGFLLLQKLSKLEMKNEENMNVIRANYEVIVMTLLKMSCSVSNPECDISTAWNPPIAAKATLKLVTMTLGDQELFKLFPLIQSLLTSNVFGDRYGGLCLLSFIVEYSESPTALPIKEILELSLQLTNDQVPRVKQAAINCIANVINRLRDTKDPNLLAIAQTLLPLISHIDDDPFTAYQTIKLMSQIVQVPNFGNTFEVLQTTFTRSIHYRSYFSKNPFLYISKIIDFGEPESVKAFYPTVIQTLKESIENPSLFPLIPELSELTQGYVIRFGNDIIQFSEPVIQLFFQVVRFPNEYASDGLVPLGIQAMNYPQVFAPYLPQFLEISVMALKQVSDSAAVYGAATALYFIILGGHDITQQMPVLLQLLTEVLADMNIAVITRRAVIDLIGVIAQKAPPLFVQFANPVMTLIRAFCNISGLKIQMSMNATEAQLMANALAKCTYSAMLAVGKDLAKNYVDIAIDILSFVSELEDVIERLMSICLDLYLYLSVEFKNDLLIAIEEEESIGQLIFVAADVDQQKASAVLNNLGYSE
ncbi:hypothetical protein GPJ56_004451 [Histomonas meleagridis]|uniref:uncharacterized protein n=1 Tax=Histomonas meleagridis TaxID=135588 RepID=UPI00355AA4AD|nr:hypothetical protein GPJ56_004451 [Histomonas meleagridis]KAH0802021.1 hypothetical protein GO595_005102 [Histomonas meleagridis]